MHNLQEEFDIGIWCWPALVGKYLSTETMRLEHHKANPASTSQFRHSSSKRLQALLLICFAMMTTVTVLCGGRLLFVTI